MQQFLAMNLRHASTSRCCVRGSVPPIHSIGWRANTALNSGKPHGSEACDVVRRAPETCE